MNGWIGKHPISIRKAAKELEDPDSVRLQPSSETLAGVFVSLGVQCVIYAAGSDIGAGYQLAPMMDRWAEKFWRIATKQSSGSVANAVELALKELRREWKKKEREGLG